MGFNDLAVLLRIVNANRNGQTEVQVELGEHAAATRLWRAGYLVLTKPKHYYPTEVGMQTIDGMAGMLEKLAYVRAACNPDMKQSTISELIVHVFKMTGAI